MDSKQRRAIRQRNLIHLIATHGENKQSILASKIDIDPSLISQIVNNTRGIGEELARKIESALSLKKYAMDSPLHIAEDQADYSTDVLRREDMTDQQWAALEQVARQFKQPC